MRVTTMFATHAGRIAILAALLLFGVAGASTAWLSWGPVASVIIVGISIALFVVTKAVMELASDAGHRRAQMAASTALVSDRLDALENELRIQQSHNEAVLGRVRAVEKLAGDQVGFGEAVLGRVRAVEKAIGSEDDTDRLSDVVSGQSFHHVRRLISPQEVVEIRRVAAEVLGFPVSESQIRYIERVILGVELLGSGRLAADSADAAIRLLASLSRGEPVMHAEIGVLSGLYAALLARMSQEMGIAVHQVLIDPFTGYYDRSGLDALTLSRISPQNARRNLRIVGSGEAAYTLIEGLSQDDAVIRQAGARRYDTILIDGDHSYGGVTADIETYGPFLGPGGMLLLDDYRNPNWPEVGQAIDDLVSQGRIEILAVISKTAIASPHRESGQRSTGETT